MTARWLLPLLAAAALGLQGCGDEPPRTTVTPPTASLPDDTVLNAPEQRSGVDPATATPAAPAGDQSAAAPAAPGVASAPPEPAPVPPDTSAMGAQPAASAPQAAPDSTPAGTAAPTEMSRAMEPKPAASTSKPEKVSGLSPAGDAAGAQLLAQRSLLVPVAGIQPTALSDNYEQRRGSRKHEAIDILAPTGTPVVAVDDGRIAKLFTSKPGGLTVYHFDRSSRLAYYYAHLQGYAPGLREGMDVKKGELIGYVGSTGNADPKAPHLHFAVFRLGNPPKWWEGEAVNPYPALSRAQASDQVAAR